MYMNILDVYYVADEGERGGGGGGGGARGGERDDEETISTYNVHDGKCIYIHTYITYTLNKLYVRQHKEIIVDVVNTSICCSSLTD